MPAKSPEAKANVRAYIRQWKAANPGKLKEQQRRYRERHPNSGRCRQWRHGVSPDDLAAMWAAQDGRCYLCGDQLPSLAQSAIDHHHGCCPARTSCRFCRRGLACLNCNSLIGMAGDDPDRLERIAASLRAASAAVGQRMAAKPVQGTLGLLDDERALAGHDPHQALADEDADRLGGSAPGHAVLLHQRGVGRQRPVGLQLPGADPAAQDLG